MYYAARFDKAALSEALANEYCDAEKVQFLRSFRYFSGYLSSIGAQTIVVETDYTDGDYLEDYSTYYARCHRDYDRRTKRVHFFRSAFDTDALHADVQADGQRSHLVDGNYLGFIVARPLPEAIIGRTVLDPYPSDGGRRHYPVVKSYSVALAGVPLVISGLAFQEQDTVLAACATVALWSAFHKTADLYGTPAPRPAAITTQANGVVSEARAIPSRGLILSQMVHAIRSVGLASEVVPVKPEVPLSSLLHAHVDAGVPAILIVEIEGRGWHAITIGGYSLLEAPSVQRECANPGVQIEPKQIGRRINEFYGHDDQIGPFARLEVQQVTGGTHAIEFQGSWKDHATGSSLRLIPKAVIIPVYNKVRVRYLDVYKWIARLTAPLLQLGILQDPYEWRIVLSTTTDLKESLRSERPLESQLLKELLRQHPRFLWRAQIRLNGRLVFELLGDATDMDRSFPFYSAVWYDEPGRNEIRRRLLNDAVRDLLREVLTPNLFDLLANGEEPHTFE